MIFTGNNKGHSFNKNLNTSDKTSLPSNPLPQWLITNKLKSKAEQMRLFQTCSSKADELVRRLPFRVALERANKRGEALQQLLGEEDICLSYQPFRASALPGKKHVGLGSNSSEAASCSMAFVLTKPPITVRAITPRKPAVRAVAQAPPGGRQGETERASVAKFLFRHLRLLAL